MDWKSTKSLQIIKDLICKEILMTCFDPEKETLNQEDASNRFRCSVAAGGKTHRICVKISDRNRATICWHWVVAPSGCFWMWTFSNVHLWLCFPSRMQLQASRDDQPEKPDSSPASPPMNVITPTRVWREHCLSPRQRNDSNGWFSRFPNEGVKKANDLDIKVDFVQFLAKRLP